MTLTQGLQPFAILNRPVPSPGAVPHKGRREDTSIASSARTLGATTAPRSSNPAQDRRLWLVADRHLHESAIVAKDLVLSEDFGDGLVRRSDDQMSAGPAALIELRARQRRPAALDSSAVTRSIGRP
jgi:hypothetical protein